MMGLRYKTNAVEFDFPVFDGDPSVRYLVASTPRCGSNFLQRALWRTGQAGAPEEYLTAPYMADFEERWHDHRQIDSNESTRDDYIRLLWTVRTSPNGVFGMKLHGSHLPRALRDGDLLPSLRGSTWIWIRRRNTVAQAVSYLMADQTGVWIVDGEWLEPSAASREPMFDRDQISVRLAQIEAEEAMWTDYFESRNESPLIIYYEDLVEEYQRVLSSVFESLGIPPLQSFPPAGIVRQATSVNVEWESRYRGETG